MPLSRETTLRRLVPHRDAVVRGAPLVHQHFVLLDLLELSRDRLVEHADAVGVHLDVVRRSVVGLVPALSLEVNVRDLQGVQQVAVRRLQHRHLLRREALTHLERQRLVDLEGSSRHGDRLGLVQEVLGVEDVALELLERLVGAHQHPMDDGAREGRRRQLRRPRQDLLEEDHSENDQHQDGDTSVGQCRNPGGDVVGHGVSLRKDVATLRDAILTIIA